MVPKMTLLSSLDLEIHSLYWTFNNVIVFTSLPFKLILDPGSCYDLPELQNPQRCPISLWHKEMDFLEKAIVLLEIYKAILDFLRERPISLTLELMKECKILL